MAAVAIAIVFKAVFVGPESFVALNKMRKKNDSLEYKLVELKMKRALLSYNRQRLERDTAYWERVFRLSGMGRKGEAFFVIKNDSLVLIYDFLDSPE
ncbi:hypothetical protein JXA84_07690 [candidate division WOR-3 bacterium]|nr:hypothetical protein [candidate division WOR-3 bacterium]